MRNILLLGIVALAAMLTPAHAYISPDEVVVVYNSAPQWNTGARQSKAVADYYCDMRNIPEANKCGVYVNWPYESMPPDMFVKYIVNDYDGHTGLKTFLQTTFGSDPNNPATDPIKAIVLCYGIPKAIDANEKSGSVDSALTLLFNSTEWGLEPISSFGGAITFQNRYYTDNWIQSPDPVNRTKPADFGEFRETDTGTPIVAPNFTIVRMFDGSHALAAGTQGILYRGTLTGGSWQWEPVADLEKKFICHDVSDICVFDSQTAFVSTRESGSIIKTTDRGVNWTTAVDGTRSTQNDTTDGISLYSGTNGWRAGSWWDGTTNTRRYYVRAVPNQNSGQGSWGNLPSNFVPKSIAGINANEAWVSGDSGIYHTTDAGNTWTQQYTGNTGDIWVKEISGVNKGWAVTATGGKILRTTDGTTWNELTSPTFSGTADLAVYDDDHVAIAYGSSSFLLWDGTTSTWTTDTSDSTTGKTSVAWVGGTDVVAACYTPAVHWRQGINWESMTPVSPSNWKMRYLVCRLDGYENPLETVTVGGQQYQIPRDVKRMIDRAVNADAVGRAGLIGTQPNGENDGKFIIDDAPFWVVSRTHSTALETCLDNLLGAQNVHREGSPDSGTNTYAKNWTNVMGYSSHGSYDPSAENNTTWWRPFHTWKDGAIGIFWNVSTDGRLLRSPNYAGLSLNSQATLQPYQLVVSGLPTTTSYNAHWIGLYSTTGGQLLTRSNFSSGTATIDLSTVTWPQDHNTIVKLHFPDDDGGMHDGEVIGTSTSGLDNYNQRANGIAYKVGWHQSLTIDLIREGCTAITGNVTEPYGWNTPNPEIILPQYATGRTWAESVWMGIMSTPWMQVAVGDPLMAPYAGNPSVSLVTPSPADSRHIAGPISLYATATPYGSGTIQKVEFWARSSQSRIKISTDSQAPYIGTWNTLEMTGGNRVYPDGNYAIEAIAYQGGSIVGRSTATRAVVVDNAAVPVVNISQPQNDDSVVTASAPVEAQAGSSPTKVEFWLFGEGEPIFAGQDTNAPYQCTVSSSTAQDGVYDLQAVAYYDAASSTSYSSRRRITLVNSSTPVTSVGGLGSVTDGTPIYLVNVPVTAGVSSAMDNAFYVEDSSRASGIRVETTDTTITQGTRVTLSGTLHKTGTGVNERHITASKVWNLGSTTCPQPMGMSNLHVGGQAPTDTVGITGGVGLYNTGLLIRVWGKVNYVGSNYVYIDDGSNLQDGNSLEGAIIVPLDGSTIPTTYPTVKGLKVYCGTLSKPGIGDYVSITGISSTTTIGSNIVRYVRLRNQNDVTYAQSYTKCIKQQGGQHFLREDLTTIPIGSKVRLVNGLVQINYGTYLKVIHTGITGVFSYVQATTQLPPYTQLFKMITVTGTTVEGTYGDEIIADCIYQGGSNYGAMSLSPGGTESEMSLSALTMEETPEYTDYGGGPFRPWPYPTAEEILASDSFKRQYNAVGAIGWVLSQPDGSIIDLFAEGTCGEWYDGRVFGLREWFEPIVNGPKLFLYLDNSVALDGFNRDMMTIDIVGATLTTLSNGQRALVRPQAVYAYTDQMGRYMMPIPWPKSLQYGRSSRTNSLVEMSSEDNWPWKLKIAP